MSAKRMFGGIGIYADEVFVALIDNDRLFLKVDDENRSRFVDAGMRPFHPFGDDTYSMSYYELPVDVLEDRTAAAEWLEAFFAAASRAKNAKKRSTKRRK